MMKAATRHFALRGAAVLALALAGIYAIAAMWNRERAHHALETALRADSASLPRSLADLRAFSALLHSELEAIEKSDQTSPQDREVATLALFRDQPTARRAQFLSDRLKSAQPELVKLIGDSLAEHPQEAGVENLRQRVAR